MNISKKHNVRLSEILDAAEFLFTQDGYEKATVNSVLEKVLIGKGTFYHYFESKEEVADGVIDRAVRYIAKIAKDTVDTCLLSAHEKMQKVINALNITESPHMALLKSLGNPANALLQQKFTVKAIQEIAPILASVVEKGIEEGIYHTNNPLETMEIILATNLTFFNGTIMRYAPEERKPRLTTFFRIIELSLGAKEGSFNFLYEAYESTHKEGKNEG